MYVDRVAATVARRDTLLAVLIVAALLLAAMQRRAATPDRAMVEPLHDVRLADGWQGQPSLPCAFSPNGDEVATSTDDGAAIWSLSEGKPLRTLTFKSDSVHDKLQ